jgi:hypothetical protein
MFESLDNRATLLRSPRPERQPRGKSLSPRFMLSLMLCIGLSLSMNIKANAASRELIDLKLYAYNLLPSWRDFECYNELIHRESRWNHKARNHSHYGLGQMRSKWYGTLDPHKQIKVHIKYLKHRYKSSSCLALKHLKTRGWH